MENKFALVGVGLFAGFVIGAGGACGWMALTAPPPEVPVEQTEEVKPERIVKVVDEQALYEARRQIDELKRQLAETGKEPVQPKVVKEEIKDVAERVRDVVQNALTPEQQAEIQAQRDAFRQQIQERFTERNEFLASIDTRHMNAQQRETHNKLLASVNRMNELRTAMMEGDAANASELRREMHELGRTVDDLYREERKTLLELTGKNMGYTGEQASQFASQIQTILDNTSSWRSMMWGGMGGGRRGGGAPRGRN